MTCDLKCYDNSCNSCVACLYGEYLAHLHKQNKTQFRKNEKRHRSHIVLNGYRPKRYRTEYQDNFNPCLTYLRQRKKFQYQSPFLAQRNEKRQQRLDYQSDEGVVVCSKSSVSSQKECELFQPIQKCQHPRRKKVEVSPEKMYRRKKVEVSPEKVYWRKEVELSPEKMYRRKKVEASPEKMYWRKEVELSPEKMYRRKEVEVNTEKVFQRKEVELSPEKVFQRKEVELSPEKVFQRKEVELSLEKVFQRKEVEVIPERYPGMVINKKPSKQEVQRSYKKLSPIQPPPPSVKELPTKLQPKVPQQDLADDDGWCRSFINPDHIMKICKIPQISQAYCRGVKDQKCLSKSPKNVKRKFKTPQGNKNVQKPHFPKKSEEKVKNDVVDDCRRKEDDCKNENEISWKDILGRNCLIVDDVSPGCCLRMNRKILRIPPSKNITVQFGNTFEQKCSPKCQK